MVSFCGIMLQITSWVRACGLVHPGAPGGRMWACGLICPLFVAQAMCFGKPIVWSTKREWVERGIKDHEVSDNNHVQMDFRMEEASMWHIKLPLWKGVGYLLRVEVGWDRLVYCLQRHQWVLFMKFVGAERTEVDLAWQECTEISLRDSVLV